MTWQTFQDSNDPLDLRNIIPALIATPTAVAIAPFLRKFLRVKAFLSFIRILRLGIEVIYSAICNPKPLPAAGAIGLRPVHIPCDSGL